MLWSASFTLEKEIDDLLFAWRGTVDSHQSGGRWIGYGSGRQKKMKKSKDSVQRAMQIAENASMDQTFRILDMRGQ
jgi:hypothetical protein